MHHAIRIDRGRERFAKYNTDKLNPKHVFRNYTVGIPTASSGASELMSMLVLISDYNPPVSEQSFAVC